jgi:acyl carrier protein
MTKQEITDNILEIACNKFEIEINDITLESTFYSIEVDSLDIVEVIIDIEKEFKIDIAFDIAINFKSVASTKVFEYFALIADYVDMILNRNKQCNFFVPSNNS